MAAHWLAFDRLHLHHCMAESEVSFQLSSLKAGDCNITELACRLLADAVQRWHLCNIENNLSMV